MSVTAYEVRKAFPSGAWLISALHNGYLVERRYYGYTRREAEAQFRAELRLSN